jgi:carbon-monoxide dehydrogenase large subunit
VRVRAAFTRTTPVDAYGGAGRSQCMYALERVVDEVARVMGLDPAAIRRRNFIPPDGFPFSSPVGVVYDSGEFAKSLDMTLELADRQNLAPAGSSRRAGAGCAARGSPVGSRTRARPRRPP